MRRSAWILVAATLLFGAEASARQWLVGLRAGVSVPTAWDFSPGPLLGADVAVQLHRLVALELVLEQSLHLSEGSGGTLAAPFTAASFGVQYRLDVTPVVPYASLGLEGWRAADQRGAAIGLGAALAVGVHVPLGERWFAGGEARYGVGIDGSFPIRQTYLARIGWRFGEF